jgi:adenosylmethionine-8-amino-7-oxononanoate aminotransferase
MESPLRTGLEALASRHGVIGQIRGRGLLLALELVEDPGSRRPFAPQLDVGQLLTDTAYDLGLIIYPRRPINGLTGDHVLIAPPLTVTEKDVTEILQRLDQALTRTLSAISQEKQKNRNHG